MNHIQEAERRLKAAGLRPTAQRLALARVLFDGHDKHVSAESLFAEVQKAGLKVSLATVYNTLHQFKTAGLLRELALEGDRTYYDTNTLNHFHLFNEEDGALTDIDPASLKITGLPSLPKGKVIDRIDVIVRVKKV
ncbi:iron response transcriptional regulator IrrA [Aestuariivirga litoralis]|uniref:iron response transcriptional regulator IrrA n=1 Tax=Aestuariivirga litoralis TaxID=2650924 RepID=UPI0018C825E1|nr:Fur family transcriptional regulator [Aestuariivirga litoralis]MBG1232718.1 transcriptional repressor [Aestuariivirga litoralis]